MISVVLADDQTLVRAGFRALLDAEDDIAVVGEAADGEQAVDEVLRQRPDVVLMDVRMPRTDGLRATARITADPRLSRTRVIVLTTFELDEYVFGALRAGAAGFLLKDMEPEGRRRGGADGRRRRRAARAAPDAQADRGVRVGPPAAPSPTAPRSTSSPRASARCWPSSAAACPTQRSPSSSCCRR